MNIEILNQILAAKKTGKKLLAILLDPDKLKIDQLAETINKINQKGVDYIFVGGSTVDIGETDKFVFHLKKLTKIPIVLFPGDYTQLTQHVDAVLFLSLLSGRNPEYLIEQQIKSVPFLKNNTVEVIPTGYVLIDGGVVTATQKVSQTKPIQQDNINLIINTVLAGEYKGKKIIYLEAGSGAKIPADLKLIKVVSEALSIPLIVGGGIRTSAQLNNAYKNGADLVVIGTAFEENINILNKL